MCGGAVSTVDLAWVCALAKGWLSIEFENGSAFDHSFVERGYGFVDLLDGIAGCDEGVQVKVALIVPLKKNGQIPFGHATSSKAADQFLFVEQHVHAFKFKRRHRKTNHNGRAAALEAEPTGPAGQDALLYSLADPNAVEDEISTRYEPTAE